MSPNAKGSSVKIQRRYPGGSWTTIASDGLSSASKYSETIKPTRGGPTFYRVLKSTSSQAYGSHGSTKTVNVFRWRSLVSMPTFSSQGDSAPQASSTINGAPFGASILATNASIVWNLTADRCDRYRAHVGMAGDSEDTASGTVDVALYTSTRARWARRRRLA